MGIFPCCGIIITTQTRAAPGALCSREDWMLDFSGPLNSIVLLFLELYSSEAMEEHIYQTRVTYTYFFVVG